MQSIHHIEAPVETVFDFFFDPRKSADVMPMPTEIREQKMTEQGTGSYMSWRTKVAGIPFEGFDVYTDVERNRRITDRSSSAMIGTWQYTFEPEGTGTRVTMEHHAHSLWALPVLRDLNGRVAARMNDAYIRRVKERVEAES